MTVESRRSTVRWLSTSDEPGWDAFVSQHPNGLIYHGSSWKRVLEDAFQHIRGRFLVLSDEATGAILAGLPLYSVRSRLLGNRVVSLPFASFCDPLVHRAEDLRQLLAYVVDTLKESRSRRLEIRTWKTTPDVMPSSLAPATVYKSHVLSLDKKPADLFKSFSKTSICQKITKASRAGVTVSELESSEKLSVCTDMLGQTRRRLGLPPMPAAFFEAMRRHLWPRKMKVFLASHDGVPVGCHIVLVSGDMWISEYSGNADGAMHGVNQLLYWETIREAHLAGATSFSFGRTASWNEGLLSYKRRWGTIERDIVDFEIASGRPGSPGLPGKEQGNSVPRRILGSFLRRAPMPVCRVIGRICYQHLG